MHILSDDSDRYNRAFAALVLGQLVEDDPAADGAMVPSDQFHQSLLIEVVEIHVL